MEFTTLLIKYGLSVEDIVTGSGAVVLLINALKGIAPGAFAGKWKLLAGLLLGLLYGAAIWSPDVGKIIVGGTLCTLAAVGGWETAKAIAHKVGQPASPR